jgi:hypothetical protein
MRQFLEDLRSWAVIAAVFFGVLVALAYLVEWVG